jgi:hypothetical protein
LPIHDTITLTGMIRWPQNTAVIILKNCIHYFNPPYCFIPEEYGAEKSA